MSTHQLKQTYLSPLPFSFGILFGPDHFILQPVHNSLSLGFSSFSFLEPFDHFFIGRRRRSQPPATGPRRRAFHRRHHRHFLRHHRRRPGFTAHPFHGARAHGRRRHRPRAHAVGRGVAHSLHGTSHRRQLWCRQKVAFQIAYDDQKSRLRKRLISSKEGERKAALLI